MPLSQKELQRMLAPAAATGIDPLRQFRAPMTLESLGGVTIPYDLWDFDASWAAQAKLVDMRQKIKCGGGGCNTPYGNHQFWDVAVPCTGETFARVMFQIPRYLVARKLLEFQLQSIRDLTLNLDNHEASLRDARIVRGDPRRFANWTIETSRLISLAMWASNLRWWLVEEGVKGVLQRPPDQIRSESDLPTRQTRYVFLDPVMYPGHLVSATYIYYFRNWKPLVAIHHSPYATAYDQPGWDSRYVRGDTIELYRAGGGADKLPPIYDVKVPVRKEDFDPEWAFEPGPFRFTPRQVWPRNWGPMPTGSLERKLTAFYSNVLQIGAIDVQRLGTPGYEPDVRPWFAERFRETWDKNILGGHYQFDKGIWRQGASWWDSPLATLWWLREQAAMITSLGYGDAMQALIRAWTARYEQVPPEMRTLDPRQLRDIARAIAQAELNRTADTFNQVYGAISGAVVGVLQLIPGIGQVLGAIVGVVLALVGAVINFFIRAAEELGLTRSPNPPFLPPPFIRQIVSTPETSVCDFNPQSVGINEINAKLANIGAMIRRGIVDPGIWHEHLTKREDMLRKGGAITVDGEPVPHPSVAPMVPPPPPSGSGVNPLLILGGGAAALLALSLLLPGRKGT